MKRRPYSLIKREPKEEASPEACSLQSENFQRWLTTEKAAIYLGKFRRIDGKPSVGAIRNMIYRKQIIAKKFYGRILISRLDLDRHINLSPQKGVN